MKWVLGCGFTQQIYSLAATATCAAKCAVACDLVDAQALDHAWSEHALHTYNDKMLTDC